MGETHLEMVKDKQASAIRETAMALYKVNCKLGYSLMGERPPKLDVNATYVIIARSQYYKYCVLIKRSDGKKYLGNDTWIVPERNMELIGF